MATQASYTHESKKKQGFIIFLKSQVSSLTSSSVDNGSFFLLRHLRIMDLQPALYTSVALGGIANFLMNKFFAFKPKESQTKTQIFKFILVWIGNLMLNVYGPKFVINQLHSADYLSELFKISLSTAETISKLTVSLLVGFFYNYPLYKYFVFKSGNVATENVNNT